jgi:ligand-binding sensor domain-containing protein
VKLGLLVFFIAFLIPGLAQQYNFISYNVEDGLAQSQVLDISQDKLGYLWIGTASGLSRFDGVNFVNYSIDDGLPDNNVKKVYRSESGDIWVATAKGLSQVVNQDIISFTFKEQYRINDMVEFQGKLYLASNNGLIEFNGADFHVIPSTKDIYIRTICNIDEEQLICGGRMGLHVYNGTVFKPYELPSYSSLNIMEMKIFQEEIYIAARNVGLLKFNFKTKKTVQFQLDQERVLSFAIHEDFIFGVGTNDGGFMISEHEKVDYFSSQNGLISDNLKCVFIDAEGNVWLGTDGKGMLKFSGKSIVSYTTQDRLSSDFVMGINQTKSGEYVFGTYDAGVTRWSAENETEFIFGKDNIADNTVWTIAKGNKDEMWYGTSSGLTILNEENKLVPHPLLGVNRKFRTILRLNDSLALLGGDDGMTVLEKSSSYLTHSELNINKLILLNDKVYCAAFDGLFVFNDKYNLDEYERINLPVENINTITADAWGNLWIGTINGLYIMNEEKEFYRFPLDEREYRAKTILGLIQTTKDDIWISTMNGVYMVEFRDELENGYRVFNYGISEGLINMECNINALYEDDQGNVWIGTSGGLVRINPNYNDRLF